MSTTPENPRFDPYAGLDMEKIRSKAKELNAIQWERATGKRPAEPGEWPFFNWKWLRDLEPFPLDVFPEPMARLATEIGHAVGCDPSLPAANLLGIAAGLIGRSACLEIKPDKYVGTTLFQVCIGWPGEGAEEALRIVAEPILQIESELAAEFWRENAEFVETANASEPVRKRTRHGTFAPPEGPVPPVQKRAMLHGGTVAEWLKVLARKGNERGITVVSPDLARMGLIARGRGLGGDRQALMRIWSAEPMSIDTVRDQLGESRCPAFPQLSIVGIMAPSALKALQNHQYDDGFLGHCLLVFPDRWHKPKSQECSEVSPEARSGWATIARRLWERPFSSQNGVSAPSVLRLSDEGRAAFDAGHDAFIERLNEQRYPEDSLATLAKLEELAARLCLVLGVIEHAADPRTPLIVSDKAASGAWRLVEIFVIHAMRVRRYLDPVPHSSVPHGARLILRWIDNHPSAQSLSFADLTRAYSIVRGYTQGLLKTGVSWLELQNGLRPAGSPELGDPHERGRPRTPTWEIHPALVRHGSRSEVSREKLEDSDSFSTTSPCDPLSSWQDEEFRHDDDAARATTTTNARTRAPAQ
jgi:hypothetical protein